jgi:hypothetical protein
MPFIHQQDYWFIRIFGQTTKQRKKPYNSYCTGKGLEAYNFRNQRFLVNKEIRKIYGQMGLSVILNVSWFRGTYFCLDLCLDFCLNFMTTPTMPRKATVSFEPAIKIQHIPSLDDLSDGEIQQLWYTRLEYLRMQERDRELVSALSSKAHDFNVDQYFQEHGLETYEASFRRALRIRTGQLRVILEHERHTDQSNQHSSNRMQGNQKKKKKTVRFYPDVQMRPIPPLSDLSSQEKQAMWYSCREYFRMHKREKNIDEAIVCNSSVIHGGALVILGLESTEDRMWRRFRVRRSQLCVLIEQENHWNQQDTDYVGGELDLIARLYADFTRESREVALNRGRPVLKVPGVKT